MNFIVPFFFNFIKNKVSLKSVFIFIFVLILAGLTYYIYSIRNDNVNLNKEVITQGVKLEQKDTIIGDLNKEVVKTNDSKIIDKKSSIALNNKINDQKIKTKQISSNLDTVIETINSKQVSEAEKSIEKSNARLDSIYVAFCDADQKACSNNTNS